MDFDISPSTGELLLNVPADPIPLQNSDYEPSSDPDQNYDYESHMAKTRAALKTDEMEPKSSEVSNIDSKLFLPLFYIKILFQACQVSRF